MEDIARILNSIFEEHSDMIIVGRSILQPIPKPGKPEGPRKKLTTYQSSECYQKSIVTNYIQQNQRKGE